MHVWRLLSFGVHKPAGQPWITKWFHSGAASLCNYTIYRTFDGTQFSRPSWGPGKWSEGQHVVTVGPLALDWLVGCLTFVFCFSSLFKTQHTRKTWYPRSMSNTMIYEIKQLIFLFTCNTSFGFYIHCPTHIANHKARKTQYSEN